MVSESFERVVMLILVLIFIALIAGILFILFSGAKGNIGSSQTVYSLAKLWS